MSKRFAIVYDGATQELKRLIDTSDDPDDSHLMRARAVIGDGEVMEAFPIEMLPVADDVVVEVTQKFDPLVPQPTPEQMASLGDAAAKIATKTVFKVKPLQAVSLIGTGEIL